MGGGVQRSDLMQVNVAEISLPIQRFSSSDAGAIKVTPQKSTAL